MPPEQQNPNPMPAVEPQQPPVAPPVPEQSAPLPPQPEPVQPQQWGPQPQVPPQAPLPPVQPQPVYGQPQPAYGQPAYGQQPAVASNSNGLAIAGLITAFLVAPVGLVLSIIALKKSNGNSGAKTMGIIGIIVSGLGILVSGLLFLLVLGSMGSLQHHAKDTKYQTDLNSLQSQLEASYASTGSYPSLSQLNDANWRTTNMHGLDVSALSPNSSVLQLVSGEPTTDSYAYNTTPAGCDGSAASPCKSYILEAVDSSGQKMSVSSLN